MPKGAGTVYVASNISTEKILDALNYMREIAIYGRKKNDST